MNQIYQETDSDSSFSNLTQKLAVVTGASSGIGRAIALEFARAGCDLIIHYASSQNKIEDVAKSIRAMGRTTRIVQADFLQPDSCAKLIDEICGDSTLPDIWVNNAGIDLLTGEDAKLSYEEKLTRLYEVDIKSTVLLSRAIGQKLCDATKPGSILNIGWDQATTGMEGASGELFAATKNSIMGYTRSLAKSLAPLVRVNCIAPGWIKTAWGEHASLEWQERVLRETPLKRWGTPQDIAKYARFLVSDEASFITGQILNVNGGAVC